MLSIPPLYSLGPRICVCGPSNSGKSTLAAAIGRKIGAPPVHLDQFRFLPDTDWQQRSDEDFAALHDDAIAKDRWVIDGNYSKLMPARLARATGIILLGDNRWANLARYFNRTLFQRQRVGNLEGNKDSVKWAMIHWIMVVSPKSLERYRAGLPQSGLPFVQSRSMRELKQVYRAWELRRL